MAKKHKPTVSEKRFPWLGLDSLGGLIVALLLWLAAVTEWSFILGSVGLAAAVFVFVWLAPFPWGGRKLWFARGTALLISSAVLVSVLLPAWNKRFGNQETPNETAMWGRMFAQLKAQESKAAEAKATPADPDSNCIFSPDSHGIHLIENNVGVSMEKGQKLCGSDIDFERNGTAVEVHK